MWGIEKVGFNVSAVWCGEWRLGVRVQGQGLGLSRIKGLKIGL